MEYITLYLEKLAEYLARFGINFYGILDWIKSINIYTFFSALFSTGSLFILIIYLIIGKHGARMIRGLLLLFGAGFILFMASLFFPEYMPSFLG